MSAIELRCRFKKHAVLLRPAPGGVLEVKCDSRFCGPRGTIILHTFNTGNGELIDTRTFANPRKVAS